MENDNKIRIYTDGACKGNPGKGGYGAILTFVDSKGQYHEKELSAGYEKTTNNRMELLAAIVALEALKRPSEVVLTSDSKYLVDAINEKWLDAWVFKNWKQNSKNPVKNIDLWKRLIKAKQPHIVEFVWIKGHAGHEYNERCDKLAVAAALGENLLIDEDFVP
ncbi:MAG: ribonuclease HI [Fusobacterium sp.]|nr:ribonuclease HI [Fusobacterium sp.]